MPKAIYILNQHDKGNVLGHFLPGLGSWVGCSIRFVNRWVKEVLIMKGKHNWLFLDISEGELPHPTAR